MWSSWSLSPIVKATPIVIKEITSPVPVLSKCPDPPATLKKKFLSLSFDPGRCTRKREKTEKQKAETSANEHPWTRAPKSFGVPAISTVTVRQVAGRRGRSAVLESATPRLFNSAIMNSPKSPAPSGDVFMFAVLRSSGLSSAEAARTSVIESIAPKICYSAATDHRKLGRSVTNCPSDGSRTHNSSSCYCSSCHTKTCE